MIFKPGFEEQNEYMQYLNKRCIDSGFKGILKIETKENQNFYLKKQIHFIFT